MKRIWSAILSGRRQDQGASAVEFAIVASLLFVLIFGSISFSIVLNQQLALNHSVREAARAAVVESTGKYDTDFAIEQSVRENAGTALGLKPAEMVVTSSPADCAASGYGSDLLVRAEYTSKFVPPIPIPLFPESIALSAEASFRCEWE